jgi:hypothetical protein
VDRPEPHVLDAGKGQRQVPLASSRRDTRRFSLSNSRTCERIHPWSLATLP